MNGKPGGPLDRPKGSRILQEIREQSRRAVGLLTPAARMEAAFTLSMDAQKLRISALAAQGYSQTEIRFILRARR